MSVAFIDLKAQYASIKPEIDEAILNVISNCNFIMGPNVTAFEKELASYLGAKHVITCASGSDALLLALMSSGIKEGDEVITTPFTFFATIGAIVRLGAKPVFADIDPRTFNIDPKNILKLLTPHVKAIIPVHLYGQSADLDEVLNEAKKRGIAVIEDCAQAIGATYRGKMVSTLGDIGCLSFFPTKNLGCYGDGGALVTQNDEIAEKLKILRVHGAKPKYFHKFVGINSRLDEIQAAVLRIKLKHVEKWNKKRREIAAAYNAHFENSSVTVPYAANYAGHIYHQYAVKINGRDAALKKINSAGIGAGVYYPLAMHLQECFTNLGYKKSDMPLCETTCEQVLSLPIYPEMTDEQIGESANALLDAIK